MEKRKTEPTSVRWSGQVRIKTLYKWRLDWRVIPSPPIWSPYILFHQQQLFFFIFLFLNNYRIDTLLIFFGGVGECKAFMRATRGADNEYCVVRITVKSKMRRIRPFFPLKVIFSVMSRLNFAGHFDTLWCSWPFRTFFRLSSKLASATALQTLARCQVLLADLFTSFGSTLSAKASATALSSVRVEVEGLLFFTSSIATPQKQKSRQLMSIVKRRLARQWWWGLLTEEHLELCQGLRAVAGAGFEGSLKKIQKGLEH